MASSLSLFFSLLLFVSTVPFLVYSIQFQVGGDKGWAKPTGNDSETYNEWAAQNRFHVGDTVHFKYQKDSVLVVNKPDYENCVTSNPLAKFGDGNTVFRFDRYGYFYFISGQPGHCKSGQRLIVRVMVHPEVEPPQATTATPPPKPAESGGDDDGDSFEFGPPGNFFSASELSAVASSSFATAAIAVFAILCLFM